MGLNHHYCLNKMESKTKILYSLNRVHKQKVLAFEQRRDSVMWYQGGFCDWLYLKLPPMKVVMRFCKKGKLSLLYVGSYIFYKIIGKVAYEL